MRRLGPFNPSTGEPDSSLPWQDGNPATGQEGSIPSHRHWTHAMEEIVNCIEQAGLQATASDLTQLWQAIQVAVEQGPGGLPGGAYVTQQMVLSTNPVYPEALTPDNKLILSAGTGEVVLAADQIFSHRGVFRHSTSDWDLPERTFATAPNKTYHLRWTPLDAFALKDLADGDYNPGSLDEWDEAFDTGYDDAIFHRVETNASNVATIKALRNADRLRYSLLLDDPIINEGVNTNLNRLDVVDFDLARRPIVIPQREINQTGIPPSSAFPSDQNHDHDYTLRVENLTRYGCQVRQRRDYSLSFETRLYVLLG